MHYLTLGTKSKGTKSNVTFSRKIWNFLYKKIELAEIQLNIFKEIAGKTKLQNL